MNNILIIGATSVAGGGKDTFCKLLANELQKLNITCKNYALADELKLELKEFIIKDYGIDPTNCSREEKEKIRDLLVFHGNYKRFQTNGRYWNQKVEEKIQQDVSFDKYKFFTISDMRYNVYDFDEYWWLKKKMGGIMVHISQYDIVEGTKFYKKPANKQEELNDPIMKALADYRIEWPYIKNGDLETSLNPYIKDFLRYLNII